MSDPNTFSRRDPYVYSFRRVGIVARPGADGHPVSKEVACYGVASVFTPASKRNKGYAAHMMSLLHWILASNDALDAQFPAEWGRPPVARLEDAAFSVLYSDVGDKFYHRNCSSLPGAQLGWVPTGLTTTAWQPHQLAGDNGRWRWLSEDDAVAMLEEDVETMKRDTGEAVRNGAVACAFLPSGGVGRCSIQRVMRFTEQGTVSPLDYWGVRLDEDYDGAPLTFATWSLETASSKDMVLTRLRATKDTFPGLLAKIMDVALRNGIRKIEAWNLPSELAGLAAELGGKTTSREEHISSIRWYGPEEVGQIRWLFNEKYALPCLFFPANLTHSLRFCWC